MSLYQIDQEIQAVLANADEITGEIDAAAFEELGLAKKEKQHGVLKFIQHLENDQDLLKKEMDRLKALREMAAKREEWLRGYLIQSMNIDKVRELDFVTHKCKFRKNPPRLIISDEKLVPEKYIKTEIVQKIDKERVKADLKSGETVEGCRLEQGESLIIS